MAPATALGVLYAAVVLAFLPSGLDQFLVPKALVLLGGVPVVAAVLLAQAASPRGGAAPGRVDRGLLVLVAAFSVCSVAAPLASATNLTLHGLGALEVVLWGALFVMAAAVRCRGSAAATRRLMLLLAAPACVVAVLAVVQGAGADPVSLVLGLHSSRPGRWQVLTTLGNPGWTAELLAASLPVLLALLPRGRRPGVRLAALTLALLMTAAVAATGSRAGLLLLAVGVGLPALLCGPGRPRSARTLLAAAAVVVAGVGISFATGTARFTELRPLTGRVGLWAAGAHLAAAHPLAGWGLRHSSLVLPEGLRSVAAHVDPKLLPWLPTTLVDRFDQDWVQTAVESGLPAALLLLAVWARAVVMAVRRGRAEDSALDRGVAVSLLVLGACSLVSSPLHTPATAALFWILAGLAAAGSRPVQAARPQSGVPLRLGRVAGGLAWVAAGLALVVGVRAARVDLLAGRGHRLLAAGRPATAVPLLSRAAEEAPWLGPVWAELAEALEGSASPSATLAATVEAARWTASERLWASQARALARLGHAEAAHTVLARGLAAVPYSPVLSNAERDVGALE